MSYARCSAPDMAARARPAAAQRQPESTARAASGDEGGMDAQSTLCEPWTLGTHFFERLHKLVGPAFESDSHR